MPARRPCATCPYRVGVPSGLWHADEYAKLPRYDGDTAYQQVAAFYCHRDPDDLCAGWVGHRDPVELLAIRIGVLREVIDPAVLDYRTDVPLFASGAEAEAHGLANLAEPDDAARAAAAKLLGLRHIGRP